MYKNTMQKLPSPRESMYLYDLEEKKKTKSIVPSFLSPTFIYFFPISHIHTYMVKRTDSATMPFEYKRRRQERVDL